MKKLIWVMVVFGLVVSACATSASPSVPSGAAAPSPIPQVDLQATANVIAQQTSQALPTPTLLPTNTVVPSSTATVTLTASPTANVTATNTENPILLTLTATLGTGTPAASTPNGTVTITNTPAPVTVQSGATIIPTDPTYPQTYGTMPPSLPAARVDITNRAKTEAYVSLQCTTKEGYVSIVEFPVGPKRQTTAKIVTGACHAVVWVGGKSFSANFHLSKNDGAGLIITTKGISVK